MDGLLTAREILSREKALLTLYRELNNQVTDPDLNDMVDRLMECQMNQIDMLNELIDDLGEAPAPDIRYAQHVVQPGETLFVLAQKYNTTVRTLLRLNPDIEDPDEIQAGMVINLPILLPPPPDCFNEYTVSQGDTLFEIAQEFDTTVSQLVFFNSISNPDLIFPGRRLIVPCPDEDGDENGVGGLDFKTVAIDNEINYRARLDERFFAVSTRFQLRRILERFDIRVPSGIDFNEEIVIGAIEYNIVDMSLEDNMITVEVERKARGYHLVTVPKDQFVEEGFYSAYFVNTNGRRLDRDRVEIEF
ncbi:LysM peptidoglycan-binding domain-containing protein [Selenihalanaerobacter shriftii]|uniref:LysM repeat-containing protein n=1 Tax=Selenihalanaerobacter shriftii TaxID=142842 RepID=A0A1T4JN06_9FIRM|nr:LysM domain-containing protein [Selenihalanaerobacter shriftii]SJZ31544.1 LysM repeat-containing protein [Selenihalanaerobacter shriftii]